MPNWCYNTLKIKLKTIRDKERFSELLNDLQYQTAANKIKLDFNTFIPYPEEYKKLDNAHNLYMITHKCDTFEASKNGYKDGFNSGGCYWCCANWGTKWNAGDFEIIKDHTELGFISFVYTTAWAPPVPVLQAMSEKYHGIEFNNLYVAEGGDYRQRSIVFYNGKPKRDFA